MEIKREVIVEVETRRCVSVTPSSPSAVVRCPVCPAPAEMMTAESVAAIFDLSRRAIYRLVEAGAAHFVETEAGEVMLCLGSLTASLEREQGG